MASPVPSPARSETQAAASPTSAVRPFVQRSIRIWLTRSKYTSPASSIAARIRGPSQPTPAKTSRSSALRSWSARRAPGRQVLVAEHEQEQRPVVAHREARDLPARHAVADVDELVARPVARDLERGDVVAERHLEARLAARRPARGRANAGRRRRSPDRIRARARARSRPARGRRDPRCSRWSRRRWSRPGRPAHRRSSPRGPSAAGW